MSGMLHRVRSGAESGQSVIGELRTISGHVADDSQGQEPAHFGGWQCPLSATAFTQRPPGCAMSKVYGDEVLERQMELFP